MLISTPWGYDLGNEMRFCLSILKIKILESGAGESRPLRSAPWGSVVGNQIEIIEHSLNKNVAINLGIGVNEESLLLASQFYTTPAMLAINASLRTTFK